jgi:hypothetical protein
VVSFASLRATVRPEEVIEYLRFHFSAVANPFPTNFPPVTAHPLFPCPLHRPVIVFRWLQSRQVGNELIRSQQSNAILRDGWYKFFI